MSIKKVDWTVRLAVSVAVVLGGVRLSNGQILIDDFNDGNDDGWRRIDELSQGGPGIFNVTEPNDPESGAYNLKSTGFASGFVASAWDNSSDPLFSKGFLRGKIRVDAEGTILYLYMRSDLDDYSSFLVFAASTSSNQFSIQGGFPRFVERLEDPAITFNVGEDWNIEGGAVGNRLSLKVWRVGEPEPPTPQLEVTRSGFSMGQIGVGANVSGSFPGPGFVDATFDDVYFTPIPEPSAWLLLIAVYVTLIGFARCRRLHDSS